MKKLIGLALALCIGTFAFAQTLKYKTSDRGVRYSIIKANKGPRIKMDDVVFLHIQYSTDKDSALFNSWANGTGPLTIKISKSTFKGDLMDALQLLTANDSAAFLFNADSMFSKTFNMPRPEFIKAGSDMKFKVKIERVTTEDVLKAEEIKLQKEKEMEEIVAIDKYVADKGLTVQTSSTGLRYIISTPGTGAQAEAGKTVKVHYTGKLLDGTKFDSSLDRNEPIEFVLGRGMVIPGWDEGIALLKEGGKALLIIPSKIAYGARGAGGVIPPFAPLTFEVELVSVQ